MENKTIFVCDDDDTFLAKFDAALRRHYKVITMSSGQKLFSLLDKFMPEIIVLDVEMPEMNGFDILSKLKSDEKYSHIPVMFLTGLQDNSMETRAFQMGISDFIMKAYVSAPILINRINLQLRALSKKTDDGIAQPKMELKTIVALDDSDTFLSTFDTAMKSYYNVVTVSSAAKFFSIMENLKPDLIVCDIEMPEMDGFEVLRKLKTNRQYRDIPVMFLSGAQDTEMEAKGFRMGIADFIEKNFFSAPILNNRIKLQLNMLEQEKYAKSLQKWK
ncbi:MAG: response regulator [Oscillospiraceae bacterium]|nr:response regulator [Oscillospiraceae bacterium]